MFGLYGSGFFHIWVAWGEPRIGVLRPSPPLKRHGALPQLSHKQPRQPPHFLRQSTTKTPKKRLRTSFTMNVYRSAVCRACRQARPSLRRGLATASAQQQPQSTYDNRVRLVEVGPRDGLQNEKKTIPLATKIELIERLARTGLSTIEAGSFVAPKWVPQVCLGVLRVRGTILLGKRAI